jgi:hypothetical protein
MARARLRRLQRRVSIPGTSVARQRFGDTAATRHIQIRLATTTPMAPHHGDSLIPQLDAAEATLRQALAEACVRRHPGRPNTGELIRLHEVLTIAGDAAKRAIAIRRRRHVDARQRTQAAAIADAEVTASLGRAHRFLADAEGVTWDVFAVHPTPRGESRTPLPAPLQRGWLCFESGAEKRRLSPIPRDWESLNDRELERLSQRAQLAASPRRRRGRSDDDPQAGGP